jgi:pyruvate formate lyase activating enzyme
MLALLLPWRPDMQDILSVKGILSEIQRFSVHDGPGIRSLIFLKGCPLRCKWCCNPENIDLKPEIMMVLGQKKLVGEEVSTEFVMDEVLKDWVYYRRSGGGVTLSGGEALMQPDFSLAILQACKKRGVHTAIETTGFADSRVIERILPYLDLVMYDIKHLSEEKHREFTEQSNKLILENVLKVAQSGVRLIIRVPVVPTFNDTEEEIEAIARFAAQIPAVRELHLLPYHRLGESKYKGLGRDYFFSKIEPLSPERMSRLLESAKLSGLQCQLGG